MAPEPNEALRTRRAVLARHILRLLGLYQLSLGGWFMVLRPPLLPEDLHYVRQASSGLRTWLVLVFNVMGGQMAAFGCALILVSHCNLNGLKACGPRPLACMRRFVCRADGIYKLRPLFGLPMGSECSSRAMDSLRSNRPFRSQIATDAECRSKLMIPRCQICRRTGPSGHLHFA